MGTRGRTGRKIISVFICLVISMGLMPIVTFAEFYPGQGTESRPYLVSSWDGLKDCLNKSENEKGENDVWIRLQKNFDARDTSEITVDPEGNNKRYHLDLAGKLLTVQGNDNQPFIVKNDVYFQIFDSVGGGIIYDVSINHNQIFYVKNNGTLEIEAGQFETYNRRVIYADSNGYAVIHGGYFVSHHTSGTYGAVLKCSSSSFIRIYGGKFETFSTNSDTPVFDWDKELSFSEVCFPKSDRTIILKRKEGSGVILRSANKVTVAPKSTADFYDLDGTYISQETDYGKSLEGTEFRIFSGPPVITKQPTAKSADLNQPFSVAVQAQGAKNYQWTVFDAADGRSYGWDEVSEHATVSATNHNALTMIPKDGWLNGKFVQCRVGNGVGNTYSDFARISVDAPTIEDTSITLSKTTLSLEKGTVETLKAAVSPSSAASKGVTWKSGNSSVATVDQNGKVTAVAKGSTTITVTTKDGGRTASCTVTVTEASAAAQHTIRVLESQGGTVSTNVTTAAKDETIIVVAVPDSGYDYDDRFDVLVMDSGGNRVPCLGNLFMMPDSDVTVKVNFSRTDNTHVTNPFTDVNDGDYFKDAVLWAVEKGITSGTGDNTFSPDGVCTRAQAVTFLWRANGSPIGSDVNPFTDVKSDDYFQQAVKWAVEQGITKGTSETTFSPDAYCTRAQIVSFLYRAAGSPTVSGALFKDVSDSDYFADAVRWAVDRGITQGTTAETFSPNEDCTRAQIVTFIYRQMK